MKKGSITLYLCLVLGVLLSLICAGLFSARRAAGRVVLASAAEQGMYSLFSRYDRNLLDTYGILALDGGYSKSQLKLGALQNEAEETVEFLTGSSGALSGPTNLTRLSVERGEVTGYTLLTDGGGVFYRQQIMKAMAGKKTASAITKIKEKLNSEGSVWKQLEDKGTSIDVNGVEEEYKNLLQSAETEAETTAFRKAIKILSDENVLCDLESGQLPAETESGTVIGPGENPIELIRGLRKLGILNLVLPKNRAASQGSMPADRVSRRPLQQGMGILPEAETDFVDKVFLMEYLVDSFTDFTEAEEDGKAGIHYQVEYAIGKKDTDVENLKVVMNRLLAVREVSNYVYLLRDTAKQEEIHTAAVGISTLIGVPVAEPVVAELLRFCWAFGESVLDLRELLKGGSIPLMKDAASWQLSLNMLSHIQEEISEQHSSPGGLNYQWYLRMLLLAQGEDALVWSLMDLTEHQIRGTEGRDGFRLDNCLVSMKIRFRAKQDGVFPLEAERSYNYVQ